MEKLSRFRYLNLRLFREAQGTKLQNMRLMRLAMRCIRRLMLLKMHVAMMKKKKRKKAAKL